MSKVYVIVGQNLIGDYFIPDEKAYKNLSKVKKIVKDRNDKQERLSDLSGDPPANWWYKELELDES